ncbi:hypothetical protein ACFQ9Q_15920 [Streptomyces virginiae]
MVQPGGLDGRPQPAELLVLDVARVTFAGSAFLNPMIRLHRTRPL